MDMEIELVGADATEENLLSLQDWVRNEQIAGLQAELKTEPPKEGELGGGLSDILSVISSGKDTAVDLAKSVYNWLLTFRPKLKVKLKVADMELEIDAQNMPELEGILAMLLAKLNREDG